MVSLTRTMRRPGASPWRLGEASWSFRRWPTRHPYLIGRLQRSQTFHGTERGAEREMRRLVREAEQGGLVGGGVTIVDMLAG